MHKRMYALFSVALVLPFGLALSPAGGAPSGGSCAETGTSTFAPALPLPGDPTLVTPQFTATMTLSGCVGLGVTGGTATFTADEQLPENCDTINAGTPSQIAPGTTVYTWNTGQTSTDLSSAGIGVPTGSGQVTGGLFQGATRSASLTPTGVSSGLCVTTGSGTVTFSGTFTLDLPAGSTTCGSPQPCNAVKLRSATATAPGLSVNVTGAPATGVGTVNLAVASGSLPCPKVAGAVAPLALLSDTGFAPTDKLTATATLPLASSTSAEQVCFTSTVPFKSQSNPTIPKAGTAFLLKCAQVANVAPCVTSSTQVGSNVVVKFVVPGGNQHFSILCPTGRQSWLTNFKTATVGTALSAHLEASGGRAPYSWKVISGTLPAGVTLNAATGALTGKPTAKGTFRVSVQATDKETPPKTTAPLPIPITVT